MQFHKIKRVSIFVLFLVAVGVIIGLTAGPEKVQATTLSDITSSSIAAKKEEIANAAKEQSAIKGSITDMEKLIKDLKGKKADVDKYIKSIDGTVSELQENIKGYESLITRKEAEILQRETELQRALEEEASQYDVMQLRIQYLYECGESSFLESLLRAESFGEMLNRAEYVEEIAAYDNQMLHAYMLQREFIGLCLESVEQEKAVLNESKAALEAEKKNLESLREQKAKDLATFEHDIQYTEASIKELEADLKFQTDMISKLEGEITEEQKAILANSGIVLEYDGGKFHWPAPKYIAVTSEFGWRADPFTGYKAYHNGIDLAAASGTPIVAAYDGIVVDAGYNSSMGNYVIIDHGTGLYTIYMHASKLYVSTDEIVAGGETIAAVGSTGRSTGPHLHFSVRLDGLYVSPWDYLKK